MLKQLQFIKEELQCQFKDPRKANEKDDPEKSSQKMKDV